MDVFWGKKWDGEIGGVVKKNQSYLFYFCGLAVFGDWRPNQFVLGFVVELIQLIIFYLGVSKNRGTPKWMVYNGTPWNTLIKIDDLGCFPIIFGNTHLNFYDFGW